ncbi:MAG: glycosyltransferase [Acidimicrobiales bacterium]
MTDRPNVTFAVLVGDDGAPGRQLLASLAAQGRRGDHLVLLGAGPRPDKAASWRALQGGSLARLRADRPPGLDPVVVVVDGRLVPYGDWVAPLVGALADPAVAVAAARANLAAGDEVLDAVPYRPNEPDVRARWARQRASTEHGRRTSVEHLGGPCLALRRADLERAGGLAALAAELPDLHALAADAARRPSGAPGELVVAEDVVVHHPGGPARWRLDPPGGRPLVSACLIVRDESSNLARCLESLAGVADEVVVHDTGSTDGTPALARRLGARVLEGGWDDDFAGARNEALAHCTGTWVLWVDADEALRCDDPGALRRFLADRPTDVEGLLVLIDNLRGNEAGSVLTHPACRLFRRACGHWRGRLHEQVVARRGRPDLGLAMADRGLVHLTHWGYLQAALAGRDKGERNVRTAFADLAGGSELDGPTRLVSLGRSHMLAGRYPEGLELCRRGAATATAPTTVRLALRNAIEGLLALERPEEARREIARLRACSTVQSLADLLDGRALLDLGDPAGALEAFDRLRPGLDDDGFEYGPHDAAAPRATALRALGRPGEAADALLDSIRGIGGVDAHLGLLVECLDEAGRPLGEIFAALPAGRVDAFVPQLLQLRPEVADRVAEAWLASGPDDAGTTSLLAAAATFARQLPVARQLVWSSRLRARGLTGACPLLAAAARSGRPPRDRALAGAAAAVAFGDPRGRQAAGAALAAVAAGDRAALRDELAALDRSFAEQLDALGAPGPAAADPGPLGPPAAGRRVLVVDDAPPGIRTAALAGGLARLGHRVTLLVPEPAGAVGALLGPAVKVVAWQAPATGSEGGLSPALRAVALTYAEQPVDVVVACRAAGPLVGDLRRLVPAATVVLDLDDRPAAPSDPGADLLWSSAGDDRPATALAVGWSAASVLPPVAPAPAAARHGACLVVPDGDGRRWALAELLPALAADRRIGSLAVLGDDADGSIARAAPLALRAGHLADPTPWLRSCRVVVVPPMPGAAHWRAAADHCATPWLPAPAGRCGPGDDDPPDVERLVDAVAAVLCGDTAAAVPAAPARPRPGGSLGVADGDPLAGVADPVTAWAGGRRGGRRGGRAGVRWRGDVAAHHSLATVNRELVRRLAGDRRLAVHVRSDETAAADREVAGQLAGVAVAGPGDPAPPGPVDVEVRHRWPPDFTPSDARRLVVVQPWEYGGLPAEWVGPLRDVVDELWVPSEWVARCAVDSGVPEDKVVVVRNGVDVERCCPGEGRFPLRTPKSTKLLFVGGCIPRKGIDVLLESYLATFTADDDVCLVVKPFGTASLYKGSSMEDLVRQAADGTGAAIEVVDGELTDAEMADLYRSCDALVHPYRGEGFGLPIAEAMACGLPVVVPDGGACLDFCDPTVGWLVPARRVPVAADEWTPSKPGAWWLEPSRLALGEAMKAVLADPAGRRRRGEAGRRRIVSAFTWEQAAAAAAERLLALAGEPSGSAAVDVSA